MVVMWKGNTSARTAERIIRILPYTCSSVSAWLVFATAYIYAPGDQPGNGHKDNYTFKFLVIK